MPPSDPGAFVQQGLSALQAGDHAKAAVLLTEAARAVPVQEMPWLALGRAELALGHLDAASAAVSQQLQLDGRNVTALLLMGVVGERQGDSRAASSFYQAAINQMALNGAPPAELRDLIAHAHRFIASAQDDYAAHLREVVGSDLSPTMREAIDLLTGKSQVYLQEPSAFYYPGLPQKWFYDSADFPWLEPMLALAPRMAEELVAAGASGFAPYVTARADRPAPNNPLLGDMAWSALYFWQNGDVVEENAAAMPSVMAALAHAPMPGIPGRAPNALFSRLLPGAHIAPHHGLLNTRLICHIPIITAPQCSLRVGNETRGWEHGKALVFDDSVEHEARNAGPAERVVLLFEIWRPEIPPEDRAAISRIFQAIESFGLD